MGDDEDEHDGGDLPLLSRRNILAGAGLLGVVGFCAYLLGGTSGRAEGNRRAPAEVR